MFVQRNCCQSGMRTTVFWCLNGLSFAQSEGQTISIAAPSLSEEEQFSTVIPSQYKCEGCIAIASQILYSVGRQKEIFAKSISEDDATEVLENACDEKNFQSYGLSLVNGKNRLTGPGIPVENTASSPGSGYITMSGGMWPKRLKSRCIEIVSSTEEEALVQAALRWQETEKAFSNHVCRKLNKDCPIRKKHSRENNSTTIAKLESELADPLSAVKQVKLEQIPQRMSHEEF